MSRQTKEQRYRKILVKFMSHKDGAEYAIDHQFTNAELAAIVPNDIVRYMKLKGYGNADADTETDHPTLGRSSALEYYKKALSFFIPMRNATWNPIALSGNPTRSVDVNELIKAVKKAEVRKQGKPSQARRELEEGEFIQTEEILNRAGEEGALMALSARLHAVELGLMSIRQEMNHNYVETNRKLDIVNRNVQRIAVQLGVRQRAADTVVGMATLAPNLRSLHALWQEYTVGIGGRKAAGLFTATERGRVKYVYHRRKVVWDTIARLVRGGYTAQAAIDMIHAAYGHISTSDIINRMRRDRAAGGHPNLQH